MSPAIDPPNLDLGVDELVDWLELCAVFNEYGVSRMDELIACLRQLEEEAGSDFGDDDRLKEDLIAKIEVEINYRQAQLPDVYPFILEDGAEGLSLIEAWQDAPYSFYIVCLITSHISGSILARPPTGNLLIQLRNRIFQIIATLAMAGVAQGSAISVGWPRVRGEPLREVLERAAAAGGAFTVRNPPGPYIPPQEKDGGIDVIAWSGDLRPPPTHFYFAQAASGKNWPGKPVSGHAVAFKNNYIQDLMCNNINHFTLIPFRVPDENDWFNQSAIHAAILDRLRLPMNAWQGLLRSRGGALVDEAQNIPAILAWLTDYRAAVAA